jgi:hypothetical protein
MGPAPLNFGEPDGAIPGLLIDSSGESERYQTLTPLLVANQPANALMGEGQP